MLLLRHFSGSKGLDLLWLRKRDFELWWSFFSNALTLLRYERRHLDN
jgi:hypothetical protein